MLISKSHKSGLKVQIRVDYEKIGEGLNAAGVEIGAAECHGIFCGLICGGVDTAETLWLGELLHDRDPADLLVQELGRDLRALAADTREDFDGPGLGFTPLMPGDDQPLAQRARALGQWVQGFLFGFGLAGASAAKLSAEAAEALADLARIAQVDDAVDGDSEEDEEAFTEILEFVWVGAMLIREDCAPIEAPLQ